MSMPGEKFGTPEFGGNGVEVITSGSPGTGSYYLLIVVATAEITCTNEFGDDYAAESYGAGLTIPCSNTGNVTVDATGFLLGVLK